MGALETYVAAGLVKKQLVWNESGSACRSVGTAPSHVRSPGDDGE